MGTKDTITKDYMADNRVFADVFNHMLYKGKNIIDPDTLHPLDTTALAVPYGSGTSEVPVQKFRDEFKSLNVMHDDSRIYLLLGIENQSETHYAMPVKNMVYDALEYAGQVENSARSHREAKQWPSTSGEYLTGFYKDVLRFRHLERSQEPPRNALCPGPRNSFHGPGLPDQSLLTCRDKG